MFSQKKSFFKGKLFYLLLIGIFAFGYWINQSPIGQTDPNEVDTNSKTVSEEQKEEVKSKKKNEENQISDYNILDGLVASGQTTLPGQSIFDQQEDESDQEDEDVSVPKNTDIESGYYLVKSVDGVIQVFHYGQEGKESLVRKTDIAFSLLSVADQELFQEGVKVNSKEELNDLLQDFES